MTSEELSILLGTDSSAILREHLADQEADLVEAEENERRKRKINWNKEGF